MNSALIKWLYLPDFFVAPKSTNLISECPLGWGVGGLGSAWPQALKVGGVVC